MATHRGRHARRGPKRKWDDFQLTLTSNGMATNTFTAFDVMGVFSGTYGSVPHQSTLSIPRFDIGTSAAGTGTGTNYLTVGFMIASRLLSPTDASLNPSTAVRGFWWTRKYQLQNNSNPPATLLAVQGMDALNWKVRTRRTLKELDDTLWAVVRADYTGFTAASFNVDLSLHVGILYP